MVYYEWNGTDYRNVMISRVSWWPIDCLILDPNCHLVILVHRILLACCLLVIIILILIIHYRCVSIVTLQHTQHNNSYQDSFKSISTAKIENFQCAGSPTLIQQYIQRNILFSIVIVLITTIWYILIIYICIEIYCI